MLRISAAICALLTFKVFGQIENQATLTLVDEADVNQFEISLSVPGFAPSADTSDISGTIFAEFNIDPVSGTTDTLNLSADALMASNVSFSSEDPILGSINITSMDLGASLETLFPPGIVDPDTGVFDADQYEVAVDRGTLTGSYTNIFGTTPLSFDYSENPFPGSTDLQGTITLTPTVRIDDRQFFDVLLILPVDFERELDLETIPLSPTVTLEGDIKATGETFITIPSVPDFATWAGENGVAADSQEAFDLSPELPNLLVFALGYTAANAPTTLLVPSPAAISLDLTETKTLLPLVIEYSTNLETWNPAPADLITGSEPMIEGGFCGIIQIERPTDGGFFRLGEATGN